MRKNIFEIGANFSDDWSSDNKDKPDKKVSTEVKTPEKHQLYFAKEKRRGKVVTLVKPFYLDKETLQTLLKTLKKKLGTGGTMKDNTLEFQGDTQDILRTVLVAEGYGFKR